jgi:hypothetical protein
MDLLMRCPVCHGQTTVLETRRPRSEAGGREDFQPTDFDLRRRRECSDCGYRFTTYEAIALTKEEIEYARMTRDHAVDQHGQVYPMSDPRVMLRGVTYVEDGRVTGNPEHPHVLRRWRSVESRDEFELIDTCELDDDAPHWYPWWAEQWLREWSRPRKIQPQS